MLEKLAQLEEKYNELTRKLSYLEIIADHQQFQKLAKAHAELEEVVTVYKEYKSVVEGIGEAKELLEDQLEPDFRAMVQEELEQLEDKQADLKQQLKVMLLPKDPNDEKNVIVEIGRVPAEKPPCLLLICSGCTAVMPRPPVAGGIDEQQPSELGGFKEVIFSIEGKGAYSRFKFESGVHRVQRIPTTESGADPHFGGNRSSAAGG